MLFCTYRCELDVSNFSDEFTKMPPTDSPAVVPPNYDKIFKGYSYVAPSILFSKNAISEDILHPSTQQTDTSTLVRCQLSDSTFFQQYDIDLNEQILGDGSFSVCRRCVKKSTNKEYAVKIVSRRIDCTQEINLLRACQGHQNIVTLYDVHQDEAHTYLVLELLRGGELLGRIRRKSKFTEAEASSILRKLVSAVSFMHSRGVVHRDLKPENLLFTTDDDNADIKIVDFGFARLKQEKEQLHTPCFTLHYAAPEVLNNDPEGYDENCDLWSLGVILYTMLCGRAPFHARSRDDSAAAVMARIKGGEFSFSSPAWHEVSHTAKTVTRGLLTVNPIKRLRMSDLKTNNWVQGNQNMPQTPLMTPEVLTSSSSAEQSLQTTFNAFHKAHREGFRLQDVLNAKLAQRRRLKKSSSENRSTSTSSTFSSASSIKSAPTTPVTSRPNLTLDLKKSDSKVSSVKNSSDELNSSIKVSSDSSASSKKENVFNFGESRVKEYLRTMSSSPLIPENYSPSASTSERISDSSSVMEVGVGTVTVMQSQPDTNSNLIPAVVKSKSDIVSQQELSAVQMEQQSSAVEIQQTVHGANNTSVGKRKRERKTAIPTRQSARIREKMAAAVSCSQASNSTECSLRSDVSMFPADVYDNMDNTHEEAKVSVPPTRRRKRKLDSAATVHTGRNKHSTDSPKHKIRKKDTDESVGTRRSQRLNVSR